MRPQHTWGWLQVRDATAGHNDMRTGPGASGRTRRSFCSASSSLASESKGALASASPVRSSSHGASPAPPGGRARRAEPGCVAGRAAAAASPWLACWSNFTFFFSFLLLLFPAAPSWCAAGGLRHPMAAPKSVGVACVHGARSASFGPGALPSLVVVALFGHLLHLLKTLAAVSVVLAFLALILLARPAPQRCWRTDHAVTA